MRLAGLPVLLMTTLLLAAATLWAFPVQARSAVVGAPLSTCVAPAHDGDQPASMFAAAARFDCVHPQTWFGAGDYWVISQPLDGVPGVGSRSRVRIGSVWQDN